MTRSRAVHIVAVSALVAFAMIANRFIPGCAEQKYLVDLPMFHAASRAVAVGDNPYDVARLSLYEQDAPGAKVQPFPYTPVVTALFRPLSAVHLDTLQPIWMIASCIGVGFLVLLSMKIAGVRSLTLAAALVVLMPVHITLVNGQLEAFLAPLLTISWMLSQREKWSLSGLLLGFIIVNQNAQS